jgi:hypothetical protein
VAKIGFPKAMSVAFQQQVEGWTNTLKLAVSPGQEWPSPTALMLDCYGGNMILPDSKKIVGDECKTFKHWTGSATCMYGLVAPSSASGISDVVEIVDRYFEDEELRAGREKDAIIEAVRTRSYLTILEL